MTLHRQPIVTTAPHSHLPRPVVVVFVGLVATLALVATLLPGHGRATPAAAPVARRQIVSRPINHPGPSALSAEQVATQVAEAVVLGTAPPSDEVTAALWKALRARPATKVDLAAGTISVSSAGIDGSEQLFEVVVTPLGAGPVPVDVVVAETDGRPQVAALPGIAD